MLAAAAAREVAASRYPTASREAGRWSLLTQGEVKETASEGS
jgi:hypothetical protein